MIIPFVGLFFRGATTIMPGFRDRAADSLHLYVSGPIFTGKITSKNSIEDSITL
jgi:hypothetical protein